MEVATAYLSFNDAFNSNLTFAAEDSEVEDAMKTPLPLKFTWSVWEQIMQEAGNGKTVDYKDAMHQFVNFSTVQEFWRLWNHMPQPSHLLDQKRMVREKPEGSQIIDSIMIFREGIRPEWEDPMNAKGGHFQFQLKPNVGGARIDEYWNNLVLGIVGGTVKPAEMITGIRLVDKLSGARASNVIRIEVWYTTPSDGGAINRLRKSVEQCVGNRLDGSEGQPPRCETKSHVAK